uniref:Protein PTHB1 n=1 Tax=Clastoptera arizonana TaxID=38151 RepID=A0A1B6CDQ0_9HEMI
MSLFKIRDLWSTQCGKDEIFGSASIEVADITISQGCECIIVGSLNGILRIFQPHSDVNKDMGYQAIDLLLEFQLPQPILQVVVGKLVSGSQQMHLGVLHPLSFAVYSIVTLKGSTQHGDQCQLILVYEHQLKKSAYCCVIGPFGGVNGRDFTCILSLDGTLLFLEQETYALHRSLPCFLLPSYFTYVPQTDSFIFLNANWYLESYRYIVIADDTNKKLTPSWTYNISETILDIKTVTWMGNEAAILVLGEKNLFWFQDDGSLKFEKRLQYNPFCFHVYVTEPDRNLFMLIVTDTSTLLVYDQSSLCWSSQLPFLPVAVCRVNFKFIQGLIVCLSESGELQCSYLGTEPSVFLAPPLDSKVQTYDEMQQKLANVQNEIDLFTQANVTQVQTVSNELKMSVRVLSSSRLCNECALEVMLIPSTPLSNVQLTFSIQNPLKISTDVYQLSSLCEKTEVSLKVFLLTENLVPVTKLDVTIVAIYVSNTMIPRLLQSSAILPLSLVLLPAPPVKEANHKITLTVSQETVPLSQLFSELVNEEWLSHECTDNAAGFFHRNIPEAVTTIVMSKSSFRYRIQGERLSSMYLLINLLISRLEAYYKARHKPINIIHQVSLLPLPSLMLAVDQHVSLRKSLNTLKETLSIQSAQYRTIQRRLLAKLRNKTPATLSHLDTLLKESYSQILETSHSIDDKSEELKYIASELDCVINLVLMLLKHSENVSQTDLKDLSAVLDNALHFSDDQGWEEVSEAGLTYLLQTTLAKTVRDQQRTKIDPLKDVVKFKKHMSTALDRVATSSHSQLRDEARGVSPIMEGEEDVTTKSRKSSHLDAIPSRLKLLPGRKSLSNENEHVDKQEEENKIIAYL